MNRVKMVPNVVGRRRVEVNAKSLQIECTRALHEAFHHVPLAFQCVYGYNNEVTIFWKKGESGDCLAFCMQINPKRT